MNPAASSDPDENVRSAAESSTGHLRISLDVFDGPLDLLLNLVRERQLDIATVPLAKLCDQYLAYIHAMEAIDVELAADYLVVAATLVFLKSKALLPPIPAEFEDPEESAEAVEQRLRERLIAYSKYREAGQDLKVRAAEASAYYLRPDGGDPTAALQQKYKIDARKLAGALAAALRAAKPEKRTIVRERVSLVEQMEVVARLVRRDGRASFFALCDGQDRVAIIVIFLALLELVRRERVRVAQDTAFGDIALLPVAGADAA